MHPDWVYSYIGARPFCGCFSYLMLLQIQTFPQWPRLNLSLLTLIRVSYSTKHPKYEEAAAGTVMLTCCHLKSYLMSRLFFFSSSALRPWPQSWLRHVTKPRTPKTTFFTVRTCGPAETNTRPCGRSGRATPSRGSTSSRPYKKPSALSQPPFLSGHHTSPRPTRIHTQKLTYNT